MFFISQKAKQSMHKVIDMGIFEKWLDEYIGLVDKTVAKFPEASINPMLLQFKQKLLELKYKGKVQK